MAKVSKRLRKQPDGTTKVTGWQVRFVDPDGGERRRSFKTQREAQRFAAEVETQKARGAYVDAAAGKISFREYAEQWAAAQPWRPNTIAQAESRLRNHIYPFIGDRPIGQIRRTELQALVKDRSKVMARSTLEVVLSYVTAVFNGAVADRVIAVSPAARLPLPATDDGPREKAAPFTIDEVVALQEGMPERWRLVVELGLGAGLRIGEALGLTVDRVDFLRREVRVDRQMLTVQGHARFGPPKTDASYRTIPIPDELVQAIAAHVAQWPHPDGLLFQGVRTGRGVTKAAWSDVWVAAVAAAGLPKGTRFHRMRHTYASGLIRAGCSVIVVQERLGHASAQETHETYLHLWPDDDDRTREAIGELLRSRSAPRRPTGVGITR